MSAPPEMRHYAQCKGGWRSAGEWNCALSWLTSVGPDDPGPAKKTNLVLTQIPTSALCSKSSGNSQHQSTAHSRDPKKGIY